MFSGVFFPLEQLPEGARAVAWISPLAHVVFPMRDLATGRFSAASLGHVAILLALGLVLCGLAVVRMRRRLIV